MATRNHSTNGAHTRSGHIKTAIWIGLRTRPRLISVSPCYILSLEYVSASRIASFFLYPLLYVYSNLSRKWHSKLYNTRKVRRAAGIWKICCWIYFIAWTNHGCIVIRKLFVLHDSLHYVQWVPYAAILQMFLLFTIFYTVEFNCLSCANNKMYDNAVFADRFRHQLTMFGNRILLCYLDSFMLIKKLHTK